MRLALATVLLLHALAHLVGFIIPWRLAKLPDAPYKTTLLNSHWDVGHAGIRIVGTLWLFTAVAFAVSAVGFFLDTPWWPQLTLATASFSLLMSVLGWPEAKIGVPINVLLIALLFYRLWTSLA